MATLWGWSLRFYYRIDLYFYYFTMSEPTGIPDMSENVQAGHERVKETIFSHTCISCDPAVFILDPVREAEAFREILK